MLPKQIGDSQRWASFGPSRKLFQKCVLSSLTHSGHHKLLLLFLSSLPLSNLSPLLPLSYSEFPVFSWVTAAGWHLQGHTVRNTESSLLATMVLLKRGCGSRCKAPWVLQPSPPLKPWSERLAGAWGSSGLQSSWLTWLHWIPGLLLLPRCCSEVSP